MRQKWRRILAGVLVPVMVLFGIPLAGMLAFAETGGALSSGSGGPATAAEDGGTVLQRARDLADAADREHAEFDGYLFRLEDTAELFGEEDLPEGIEDVPYADGVYEADSLEQILDFVPAEEIISIEPNYTVYLQDAEAVPDPEDDDPYYLDGSQWNLDAIDAASAWELGLEGRDRDTSVDMDRDGDAGNDDIVVAIIDSGMNPDHEDFDYDNILEGKTFLSGTSDASDALGHGTFIAGIIAGSRDNARGISGIADQVKILPLRVFNRGNSSLSTIVSAINYAVAEKTEFETTGGKSGVNVSVINMSLGFSSASSELQSAVERAIAAGIIVVCSAGNAGSTAANYPAQYAIGVGATAQDGTIAGFSQKLSADNGTGYENKLWVTAPGKNMVGPYYYSSSAYMNDSGTSFAAPQTAALAAICKSIDNTMTHDEFRQLLKDTAVRTTGTSGDINGQDVEFGWGVINIGKTVGYLLAQKSGTARRTVSVVNENGTALSGVSCRVFETGGDGGSGTEILPDTGGYYTLTVGQRYIYRASADGYEEQDGHILALTSGSGNLTVTLRSPVYPTRFIVQDEQGGLLDSAGILLRKNNRKTVDPSADGTYLTGNGTYSYTVEVTGLPAVTAAFTLDDPENEALEDGVHTVYVKMDGYISREASCTEAGEAVSGGTTTVIPALGHAYGTDGICTRCGGEEALPADDPAIEIEGTEVSRTELKRLAETAYLFYWPDDSSYYDRRVEGVYIRDLVEQYGSGERCVRQIEVTDTGGTTKYYPVTWFDETMLAWNIDGRDLTVSDTSNGFRMAVNDGNDNHWMTSPAKIVFTYRSHNYSGSETVTVAPTCGTEGYTAKTCSICGHETRTDVVPATGEHNWDSGHPLYDKNGKASGVTVYYCTECGETRVEQEEIPVESVPMYRLYNPNSGEHFFTGSQKEKEYLEIAGWRYEGKAWNAPTASSVPVYRLYNAYAGDHHYTTSADERDGLQAAGWRYEGVAWNSDDDEGQPVYRLYNPNAYSTGGSGAHHYTTSEEERDYLVSLGWRDEGIAWYGVK